MNTRALCVLSLGFCLLACRQPSEDNGSQTRVESPSITAVGRKYPAFSDLLHETGIKISGSNIGPERYSFNDTVHVVLPDSGKLRNWDKFQEFYNEAGNRMGWRGRVTLSDRMRKVRIQLQLDTVGSSGHGLVLEDSTGYFLEPRSTEFEQGSDRIEKTPIDAGMFEGVLNERGYSEGVRCNGLQDINGRLYYSMTAYSSQINDNFITGRSTRIASLLPHLVDAITGEYWLLGGNDVWIGGKGAKIRLLRAFPDTGSHDWRVVSSDCAEDGYFWQYQVSTRTLERISLKTLKAVATESLPPKIQGNIVMIHEQNSPWKANYLALSLVHHGGHFTVLRSRASTMFAQRWDLPQPENTLNLFLGSGSDRNHFSFDGKEYAIDSLPWTDLVAPPAPRYKPATEDDFYSH